MSEIKFNKTITKIINCITSCETVEQLDSCHRIMDFSRERLGVPYYAFLLGVLYSKIEEMKTTVKLNYINSLIQKENEETDRSNLSHCIDNPFL